VIVGQDKSAIKSLPH